MVGVEGYHLLDLGDLDESCGGGGPCLKIPGLWGRPSKYRERAPAVDKASQAWLQHAFSMNQTELSLYVIPTVAWHRNLFEVSCGEFKVESDWTGLCQFLLGKCDFPP